MRVGRAAVSITVKHLAVLTPNRGVTRGQRGVDETVLHDHKNNSTNGIRNIPSLRRDIDAFATPVGSAVSMRRFFMIIRTTLPMA